MHTRPRILFKLPALILAVLMLCTATQSHAGNVQFRHITEKQGLKHTWVQHITRDSKGFMWFSTIYGAYRYDGYNFEEYVFPIEEGTEVARINIVHEDTSGAIWFGTDDGLYRHDPDKGTFIHYNGHRNSPVRLSSSYVEDILEDSYGNIWIAGNGGIDQLKPDNSLKNWPVGHVRTICIDYRENLWAGTISGKLMRMDHNHEDFQETDILEKRTHPVHDIYQSSDHDIWISTTGGGLTRYMLQQKKSVRYNTGAGTLPNDIAREITEDKDGNIWVATERGIAKFTGESCEFITSHDNNLWSLNDNAVYSLYCDEDNNLWAGTFFGGVNVMYSHFGMFDFLLSDSEEYSADSKVVSSIVEIGNELYIGTENEGVFILRPDGSTSQISTANSSITSDNIHAICMDSKGSLFLGSYYGGLFIRQNGYSSFRNIRVGGNRQNQLLSNSIYSICNDSSDNIWIGTQYGGLYRYNRATGYPERFPEEFPPGMFIWDIHEDKTGDIWLACYGNGIYRLSTSQNYAIERIETESNNYITLCELDDGRIIAGSEKEGITVIDPRDLSSKRITSSEGLPDNTIYGILQDNSGNIWMSSNAGLCKADAALKTFTNYTIADGLPTNRFNYNAAQKIDGKLYFGSINGVVVVDPEKETKIGISRPVRFCNLYINSVKEEISPEGVLYEDINLQEEIRLKHWQNSIGIDFTCNVFGYNWGQSFAYRMHGLDQDWHMLGTQRRIDFIGLKPGRYTLEVAGIGNDGQIGKATAVRITIIPVWWQSTIAKICMVLLILMISLWLINIFFQASKHKHELELEKLAREKDKEINEVKLKFFVNISHEFKTPLSLILGPIEQLIHGRVDQEKTGRYFNIIKKNADKLLALINELLAFRELQFAPLKTSRVRVSEVVNDVLARYDWLFEDKEIKLIVDVADDIEIEADSGKLEKIFNNLISNSYKHTSKGDKISVSASRRPGYVHFCIEDSGEGIAADQLPHIFDRFFTGHSYDMYSSGVGLSFVKSLIEQHGGTISASSEYGKYTKMEFELPYTVNDAASLEEKSAEEYKKEYEKMRSLESEPMNLDFDKEEYQRIASETVVLIVEDDHYMRDLLVDHFSRKYNVMCADSGEVAAKIVHETRIDIVISDVMLAGGMTGFELCHLIKNSLETSHIKVILMTVLSEQDYKFQGYHAGADAYVVKPFTFSLLELRIRNLLLNTHKMRESYKIEIDMSNVEIKASNTDEQLIRKVVDVIFEHLPESEFSVDDLCLQVGMSKATLYRKLKAITGQSTNEFMQNTRLKYAARILTETDRAISDVAYDVGFSDPYYFSRAFKKLFGKSPKQWRSDTKK